MPMMTPLDFANQYLSLQVYLYQPEPGAVPEYPLQPDGKL